MRHVLRPTTALSVWDSVADLRLSAVDFALATLALSQGHATRPGSSSRMITYGDLNGPPHRPPRSHCEVMGPALAVAATRSVTMGIAAPSAAT